MHCKQFEHFAPEAPMLRLGTVSSLRSASERGTQVFFEQSFSAKKRNKVTRINLDDLGEAANEFVRSAPAVPKRHSNDSFLSAQEEEYVSENHRSFDLVADSANRSFLKLSDGQIKERMEKEKNMSFPDDQEDDNDRADPSPVLRTNQPMQKQTKSETRPNLSSRRPPHINNKKPREDDVFEGDDQTLHAEFSKDLADQDAIEDEVDGESDAMLTLPKQKDFSRFDNRAAADNLTAVVTVENEDEFHLAGLNLARATKRDGRDEVQTPKSANAMSKQPKHDPRVLDKKKSGTNSQATKGKDATFRSKESATRMKSSEELSEHSSKDKKQKKRNRPDRGRQHMDWDTTTRHGLELKYGEWKDPFVVIDKPSGIPVEDSVSSSTDTVASRVRLICNELGLQKDYIIFPHRIDKWASGLQVVAFDTLTAARLQRSMRKGMWHKRYRLLVQIPECVSLKMEQSTQSDQQSPEQTNSKSDASRCALFNPLLQGSLVKFEGSKVHLIKKGLIQSFMARHGKNYTPPWPKADAGCTMCNTVLNYRVKHPFVIRHLLFRSVPQSVSEARHCRTCFIHRFSNVEERVALYEAVPQTGRTHQLRIHFSDAGFPILGDPYYNPYFIDFLRKGRNTSYLFDTTVKSPHQMALQASLLSFPHPLKNETVELLLPDPPLWKRLLGPEYDPAKYELTPKTSAAEVSTILRWEHMQAKRQAERAREAENKPPVLFAEGFEAFMQSLEGVRADARKAAPSTAVKPVGKVHIPQRRVMPPQSSVPPGATSARSPPVSGSAARSMLNTNSTASVPWSASAPANSTASSAPLLDIPLPEGEAPADQKPDKFKTKVFIRNVDWKTDPAALHKFLTSYGTISEFRPGKGKVFVQFSSPDAVQKLLDAAHSAQLEFLGRPLQVTLVDRVQFSKDR